MRRRKVRKEDEEEGEREDEKEGEEEDGERGRRKMRRRGDCLFFPHVQLS